MRTAVKVLIGAIAATAGGVGTAAVVDQMQEPAPAVAQIKASRQWAYPGETVTLTAQGYREGQRVNGTATWESYDQRNLRVLNPRSGVLYALRPGTVAIQATWISQDLRDTVCMSKQMVVRDRRGIHSGNTKADSVTYIHQCGTAPKKFLVPVPWRTDTVYADTTTRPCAFMAYGVPARISEGLDTAYFIGKPTYDKDDFPHERLGMYCIPYNMAVLIETDSGRGRFGSMLYPATPKFDAPGYRPRDF